MSKGASSRLDQRYIDHLLTLLRPILAERFGGNVSAFVRDVGVNQGQFSQFLRGKAGGKGVGITSLIALRRYMGMSIDELLGLEPLPKTAQADADEDRIRRVVLEQLALLEQKNSRDMARAETRPGVRKRQG